MFLCSIARKTIREKPGGDRSRRFTLPDSLTLSGEEDALEARRRLFYVAMTRAKRHLTLSYSHAHEDGKPLNRVRLWKKQA